MLPRTARIMHKWSIVRSLHHHDAGHSSGDQICFTGYDAGRNPDENSYPSCGSIVSKQLGQLDPRLPSYVMIPRMLPGAGPAYLGVAHKPFETGVDPADPGPFRVPNSTPSRGPSANATASSPRGTRGRRTAAAPRRGASGSCSPAGWSRRGSGS
jgi:hypothetical protein